MLRIAELRPKIMTRCAVKRDAHRHFLRRSSSEALTSSHKHVIRMHTVISEPAIVFIALRRGQRFRCAVGADAVPDLFHQRDTYTAS